MKYLIWSNEHAGWWAPHECGYTVTLSKAGRYSRDDAHRICAKANKYIPDGDEPNEVALVAPESAGVFPNG